MTVSVATGQIIGVTNCDLTICEMGLSAKCPVTMVTRSRPNFGLNAGLDSQP